MLANESVSIMKFFIHERIKFLFLSLLSCLLRIIEEVTNFAHHFAVSSYVRNVAWLSWA